MVYGAVNGQDTGIRYSQDNNVVEAYLAILREANEVEFSLESCNVEATACGIEAVAGVWKISMPQVDGKSFMGYGDLMFDYITSPRTVLPVPSSRIPNNEIIENLAYAAQKLADVVTKIYYFETHDKITTSMIACLKKGAAIVLSYLTDYGSGHYITVVGWDDELKVFICYDPWGENKHCEHRGILETYDIDFFENRARKRFMEVQKG